MRLKSPSGRDSSPDIMLPDSRMCCASSRTERASGAGRKENSFSGRLRSSPMTPCRVDSHASRASSNRVVRSGISPTSALSFTRRSALLQVFEPIEYEVQVLRSRFGGLVLDHEKTLAVGGDVPGSVIALEEELGTRSGECRRSRDRDAHDLLVLAVENLASVGRPERPPPALRRDLPLPARSRKGGDINLDFPRLVGLIGHPAAIG